MSDTTIVNLRTTRLSIPWRDGPPAAGIVDPLPRQFLVVEIATKGGLTGMGYLHMLGDGSETIEACLKEMVAPRILGRDATEVEGIWQMLWKSTYSRRSRRRRDVRHVGGRHRACGTSSASARTCRCIGCGATRAPRCRPTARAAGAGSAATA